MSKVSRKAARMRRRRLCEWRVGTVTFHVKIVQFWYVLLLTSGLYF